MCSYETPPIIYDLSRRSSNYPSKEVWLKINVLTACDAFTSTCPVVAEEIGLSHIPHLRQQGNINSVTELCLVHQVN
jgi:hypothetical protein